MVFYFLLESSFEQTSSFVNLILRSHSEGCYRNLLQYRDRPKRNSHFLRSGFLLSHLISFLNVLMNINCSLNCYLVKNTIDSSYYSLLLFEFLDSNKCSCSVLFLNSLLLFLLTCFHLSRMIFFFLT